jgi:hypothetical protein
MELRRSNRQRSPSYDAWQFEPNAIVDEFGRCGGDNHGLARCPFSLWNNAAVIDCREHGQRGKEKRGTVETSKAHQRWSGS